MLNVRKMEKLNNKTLLDKLKSNNNYVIGQSLNGLLPKDFFSTKTIIKFHFQHTYLSEHKFNDATFEGCVFTKCDLSKLQTKNNTFQNCVFIDCNIVDSSFVDGIFTNTHFENCDLSRSSFKNLTFNFSSIEHSKTSDFSMQECKVNFSVLQNELTNHISNLDTTNIISSDLKKSNNALDPSDSYWIKERKNVFMAAFNYFELIQPKYNLTKEFQDSDYGICKLKNKFLEFEFHQDRYTESINKSIINLDTGMIYNYGYLMFSKNISEKENIAPLDFLNRELAITISIKNIVYLADKYLSDLFNGDFTKV